MAHCREEARFRAACRFRPVACIRQCVLQSFSLGDVTPDALDFDKRPYGIADRVVFPGNPTPAIYRADVLIVLDAHLAALAAREAAENRCAAVGMKLRSEGLAERCNGIRPNRRKKASLA